MITTQKPTTHIHTQPTEQVVEGYADQIKELSRGVMNKEAEVSGCGGDGYRYSGGARVSMVFGVGRCLGSNQ